jgi:hypothetical protein
MSPYIDTDMAVGLDFIRAEGIIGFRYPIDTAQRLSLVDYRLSRQQ